MINLLDISNTEKNINIEASKSNFFVSLALVAIFSMINKSRDFVKYQEDLLFSFKQTDHPMSALAYFLENRTPFYSADALLNLTLLLVHTLYGSPFYKIDIEELDEYLCLLYLLRILTSKQ